jgi:hypothetical protein
VYGIAVALIDRMIIWPDPPYDLVMPLSNPRKWHRLEHAGRQFAVLIEQVWPTHGVPLWRVVKIDERVSDEEVRLVAAPDVRELSEANAIESARALIARHLG